MCSSATFSFMFQFGVSFFAAVQCRVVQQFALVNICKYAASNAGKCSHTTGRLEKLLGPFGVSKGEGLLQRDCMEKKCKRSWVCAREHGCPVLPTRDQGIYLYLAQLAAHWLYTGCTAGCLAIHRRSNRHPPPHRLAGKTHDMRERLALVTCQHNHSSSTCDGSSRAFVHTTCVVRWVVVLTWPSSWSRLPTRLLRSCLGGAVDPHREEGRPRLSGHGGRVRPARRVLRFGRRTAGVLGLRGRRAHIRDAQHGVRWRRRALPFLIYVFDVRAVETGLGFPSRPGGAPNHGARDSRSR
jgi:hypothetical protein